MRSLDAGPLNGVTAPDEEGKAFNASAVTGPHGVLIFALLRFVEENPQNPLADDELMARFRAHVHRGLGILLVQAVGPLELARVARSAADLT